MLLNKFSPKQSLNKAYLKEKISRSTMDQFKQNFAVFLNHTNVNRNDEEHLKSQVAYFLRDTWFKESHHINPIGKNDLVIHTGKSTTDPVGVIIEVKSLTNKAEMLTLDKPNTKALHELVLYYLRQRVDENNNEIKYLIATNIDDWYIFDANEFDKKIFRNSAVKKLYELKKADNKDNPWFYDELKKLFDHNSDTKLEVVHFSVREFEEVLLNSSLKDDNKLIGIYKLLSPVHLLKLPFANDSNSLQPKFYAELLHLIGLTEIKEGSKKLIQRKKAGERNGGSLIENTISQLESHDKLSRIDKPSQFGETSDERLFNVALELVITWINRILFLKLLEAQLASYHKGDKTYRFLNKDKIKDFDDLDKLFFSVLAKQPNERREEVQKLFAKVPYLNSSLFEPTELEHQTLFIYGLEDRVPLPAINSTVLKDASGKVFKGSLDTIDYLFAFLDAYDFSSEGAEEIQEDNKTLINASVLGLIFEKINGYKDGSFFTPGFITMYMCRETIRRAVLQKFNESKGWDCKEYDELYDKIENGKEANGIINSLKICDPAVGSGHFLVSALNEIIAIKSELRILLDRDGRRLKEYQAEVVNDELVVTDDEGQLFEYNPRSKESQRVQEALFHEKQTIIENCLFGVDINPNSVKICRLRLWIELLKNAYYRADDGALPGAESQLTDNNPQLETLPNIDINIKTGNSLISRFALDADLKAALRGTNWNINDYKIAVAAYKEVSNKEQKHQLVKLIDSIKSNFSTKFYTYSKENKDLNKLRGEQTNLLTTNIDLFGAKKGKKDLALEAKRLEIAIGKKELEIEEIKNNKIYENAFEWRFEFPEVLNDEGDFVGFDVVVGNPPYIKEDANKSVFNGLHSSPFYQGKMDIWTFFGSFAFNLIKTKGLLSLIAPNNWITNFGASVFRNVIIENARLLEYLDFGNYMVFDEASIQTMIFICQKQKSIEPYKLSYTIIKDNKISRNSVISIVNDHSDTGAERYNSLIDPSLFRNRTISFLNTNSNSLIEKIESKSNFKLLPNEIGNGIDVLQDFLKENHIRQLPYLSLKKGAGVFILNEAEINNLCLSENELAYLKPYYNSKQIRRYVSTEHTTLRILYADKYFRENINSFPNLKGHIDKFTPILTSAFAPYGLHRTRDERFFKNGGIFGLRKTVVPSFTCATFPCYVTRAFLIIKTDRIDEQYLTGYLNSKISQYWLMKKGKIQGNQLQIDKEPLLNLPIMMPDKAVQNRIAAIVDDIITIKSKIEPLETVELESEIDQLVYQLYNLTEEEIKIVEGVA